MESVNIKTQMLTLTVNKKSVRFNGDPAMPLLWFLREELGLTGTKFGCGMALCGACTVHMDGVSVRSCMLPVGQVAGKSVTTIEAVADTAAGKAVQDAWVDLNVVQCGYCQSGQIMSASALLQEKRDPSDADIDAAMSGNICRCATYVRIKAAIRRAAKNIA
jgi:isoquinoline 1-oxidoreductase alpha subunit